MLATANKRAAARSPLALLSGLRLAAAAKPPLSFSVTSTCHNALQAPRLLRRHFQSSATYFAAKKSEDAESGSSSPSTKRGKSAKSAAAKEETPETNEQDPPEDPEVPPYTTQLPTAKVKPRERMGAPAGKTGRVGRPRLVKEPPQAPEIIELGGDDEDDKSDWVKSPHAASKRPPKVPTAPEGHWTRRQIARASISPDGSEPTTSRFSQIPAPRVLKSYLDQFAIGQDRAKKHFSVAVYNHYVRLADRQEVRELAQEKKMEVLRQVSLLHDELQKMKVEVDEDGIIWPLEGEDDPNVPEQLKIMRREKAIKQLHAVEPGPIVSAPSPDPEVGKYYNSLAFALTNIFLAHLRQVLEASPRIKGRIDFDAIEEMFGKSPEGVVDPHYNVQMEKSNVLLLGPTGSGKTMLARILARFLDVPFVITDCTAMTQAGYVGEDPDSCISQLGQLTSWNVEKMESGIVVFDEFDKISSKDMGLGSNKGVGGSDARRDVAGTGVQQGMLKLIEGTRLSIPLPSSQQSGFGTSKTESITVDTSNILFIFMGAFVGLQDIVLKRLEAEAILQAKDKAPAKVEAPVVHSPPVLMNDAHNEAPRTLSEIFGAEVEEARRMGRVPYPQEQEDNEADEYDYEDPVQEDLVERSRVAFYDENKEAVVPTLGGGTAPVLSYASHADLIKYGILPELAGRIAVVVTTSQLSQADLERVLTEPRNSVVRQYERLFSRWGVTLAITRPAIVAIAARCIELGIGARGLPSIINDLLLESNFESPASGTKYILVTKQVVEKMKKVHAMGPHENEKKSKPEYFSKFEATKFLDAVEAEDAELAGRLNKRIYPHFSSGESKNEKKKAAA